MSSPEKVFRIGYVSASVFVNEIKTDGGNKNVRNVNLQRRYKDGDEWKQTSSFRPSDAFNLILCVYGAATYGQSSN